MKSYYEEVIKVLRSSARLRYGLLVIVPLLAVVYFLVGQAKPTQASQQLRIAVAQWRQEGSQTRDVQSDVYALTLERLANAGLEDVHVITIPESLQNANDVDRLALAYGVDMIIWGWYDGATVWSYVDLANATEDTGLTNSLKAFLDRGGSTTAIRVLRLLSQFQYDQEGVHFCVPRWTP